MKNILKISVCILPLFLHTACESTAIISDQVLIQIENISAYDMKAVTVIFPEDEVIYGDVSSGDQSSFEAVDKAYRYAYVETMVNDKELVLIPIDYVGESLLKPGMYVYQLDIDEEIFNSDNHRHALTLSLRKK